MTDPMRWGDGMLHFGDALDCDYPWLPPSKIDDYATSVRLVGRKVEEAADAFDTVDRLTGTEVVAMPASTATEPAPTSAPADESAGLTAEAMRERALRLREELTQTRSNISGVAAAMHAYADALRVYRDDLRDLRDHAVAKGLDVRKDRIFAPVTTPPDAGTRAAERWEDDWKTYSVCFEWMREARTRRWEALKEMKAALFEHAGVRPRAEADKRDPRRGAGKVDHGDGSGAAVVENLRRLRRDAAQAAAEAIRSDEEAQEAYRRFRSAEADVTRAAEELTALRRSGADQATLDAKRAELHDLEERASHTAAEARDRAAAAEEQRARAHEAAREHEEARDRRAGRDGVGSARVSGL